MFIMKKSVKQTISVLIVLVIAMFSVTSTFSNVRVSAATSSNANIDAIVSYANQYAKSRNPAYSQIDNWVTNGTWFRNGSNWHCTNLVSQALMAGGIDIPKFNPKLFGGWNNTMWSVAKDSFIYLYGTKGYDCEVATATNIRLGDVLYYSDSTSTSGIYHAAICVGFDSKGIPIRAQRTNDYNSSDNIRWDYSTYYKRTIDTSKERIYVVHLNVINYNTVSNGYYMLNFSNGQRFDNSGSNSVGALAHTWQPLASNHANIDNQVFYFRNLGNGFYSIQNKRSGLYLDANGANFANSTRIIQYPWHGGRNQQWRVIKNPNGTISIENRQTSKVIDDSGSKSNGGTIHLWQYSSTNVNQQIRLTSWSQTPQIVTPTQKSYTIQSSSGAKTRTGAGTGYSQVGGVAKGSVIKYTQSKSANGYTWILIESGSTFKNGTWGKTTGYWVAML